MTPSTASEIQAEMAALNLAYQARLTDDLLALQAQVASLARPDVDVAGPLASLFASLHQLIGSAGTFGEVALSEAARELELLLRSRQRQAVGWPLDERKAVVETVRGFSRLRTGLDPHMAGVAPGVISGQVRRVDVLEDDPSILSMLVSSLRSFGYAAEGHAGVAALEQSLARRRPDAMIVDVHLGAEGGNGLALLEALQDRCHPPIPTLVITTRDDFEHRLRAVRAGAVGFFSKPVDLPQLENRLELCFDDYRGEPFRVVAVDDDPLLLARYQLVLGRAGVGVYAVSDPVQLHDTLNAVVPDLLLLDVQMPGCSGAELAQMVRFDERWIGLPIIYVSAEADVGLQTAAMVRGGDEFMIKPIDDSILVATVLSRARRSRALANALARDSLTGLLKHGAAKEQLSQALSRAVRAGQPCSIAMIDLDHFKRVNDTHGHATGDKVIRALASLLKNSLRKDDIVGRYGGEEFLVVMNNLPASAAATKLDRLRAQFSALEFQGAEAAFQVSFSAGVSDSRSVSDMADVLIEADGALYRAKDAGRNRILTADDIT